MSQITQIFNFAMDLLSNIGGLYTSNFLLASVIALFIFGKLINIIRRVLPHG